MPATRASSRLNAGRALAPAGQRSLKEHNLALVLAQIAAQPQNTVSRADVAERTGLTKATVSSLVNALIAARFVTEESPETAKGPGRPAIPLRLASGTLAAIGMEINVDYLGVRVLDLTGAVLGEHVERLSLRDSDPIHVFELLLNHVCGIVDTLRGVTIVGAALALPGIADRPHGPLRLAPNLGWRDLDIPAVVREALRSVPRTELAPASHQSDGRHHHLFLNHMTVDNEANLAALVEISLGENSSFIYVSGEVGIGAAIVVDGAVFTGLHGWAGEIGHIVVDPQGPTCACGANGCLEMYAGKRSIMKASGLADAADVDDLLAAISQRDPHAEIAIDQAAHGLGIALANCMNVVDVPHVVLGGDFAPLSDVLAPGLTAELSSRVLASRWVSGELTVHAASAGSYPALTGAAIAVFSHVLADPATWVWGEEATLSNLL